MLLSVHIPKTAGVSFRNVLKDHFGASYAQFYGEYTDASGRTQADVPVGAGCLHGSFVADELAARFPSASLVAWVRDPVERVASAYHQHLRDPDPRDGTAQKVHAERLDLVEYAGIFEARNRMAHFLGRMRPSDFDFIGVIEYFDESLERFCGRFGVPPQRGLRDNCNPARSGASYDLPATVREEILELNRADAEIYAECLEIFHALSLQRQLRRVG